jgi:UDP-N-acetylglucosamine/UDP-N-acetylgalactosamine 4-epimerase
MIKGIAGSDLVPKYASERPGDVKHSLADISKARKLLEYDPSFSVREGMKIAFEWYRQKHHFAYS